MQIKNKKKIYISLIIGLVLIVIILIILSLKNEGSDILKNAIFEELTVTSDAFENGGTIPIQYTGRGEDISPNLNLSEISEEAKSIAIIMDDHDVPVIGIYNHWVIWNIPVLDVIPEAIPHGEVVDSLDGAIQGNGYGKHRYRGPKPPSFNKKNHHYQFHVYVLDCMLDLNSDAGKKDLLKSMDGHIIQYGYIIGIFK